MAPQTSVSTPDAGIAGQIATMHTALSGSIVARTSEEASAGIPFGVFVKPGTADDTAKLISATSSRILGVTVYANGYAPLNEVSADGTELLPGTTFDVMRTGSVMVRVEDAVTPASEVHVRAVTGGVNGYGAAGAENAGAVRGTADGTDCIDITAFASFVRSAGAGELVELEIDCRNSALQTADV